MINNNINDLNPLLRVLFEEARNKCVKNGHTITVLETVRNKKQQYIYYCYGRPKAQLLKARVPENIINEAYSNSKTNLINLDKKVNSLYSIHFEGKALDIESDDSESVNKIFEEYGFITRKIDKYRSHLEIPGHYQNTFKFRLCTNSVVILLKNILCKALKKDIPINGFWDRSFIEAMVEFKVKHNLDSSDIIIIDEDLLKKLLKYK